jgi:hypothetical protein
VTRKLWTAHEKALLRELYPDLPTRDVAARLGRELPKVYAHAQVMGLCKSAAFYRLPASGRIQRNQARSVGTQFPKGHVPANKGNYIDDSR